MKSVFTDNLSQGTQLQSTQLNEEVTVAIAVAIGIW